MEFSDVPATQSSEGGTLGPLLTSEFNECIPFDVRDYRPFSVTVSVSLHDIHGHLVKVRLYI